MADEKTLAARLDDMIEVRWSSLRTQARRDAAMALIESQGSATNEEIEQSLTEHTLPSRNELRDAMARKAASGVTSAEEFAEHARAIAGSVREHSEKMAEQARAAEDSVAEADAQVEAADQAVVEARELAAYVSGDPDSDEPGSPAQANAESASAGAESGE